MGGERRENAFARTRSSELTPEDVSGLAAHLVHASASLALPLSTRTLRRAFFGMPLMTLGVVGRIHWQALRLALKRVPFFRKPLPPTEFVTR